MEEINKRNGNYCFENCTFIPKNEQSKNRRNTKIFKKKGGVDWWDSKLEKRTIYQK